MSNTVKHTPFNSYESTGDIRIKNASMDVLRYGYFYPLIGVESFTVEDLAIHKEKSKSGAKTYEIEGVYFTKVILDKEKARKSAARALELLSKVDGLVYCGTRQQFINGTMEFYDEQTRCVYSISARGYCRRSRERHLPSSGSYALNPRTKKLVEVWEYGTPDKPVTKTIQPYLLMTNNYEALANVLISRLVDYRKYCTDTKKGKELIKLIEWYESDMSQPRPTSSK